MHPIQVFIDGEAGTTGLQIRERLAQRSDVELIRIHPDQRKNHAARLACMQHSDVTILCLHDAVARAAIHMLDTLPLAQRPRVIDASSAHRVAPGWVYGFAEMDGGNTHASAIRNAERVSNPGCYGTGAIALLRPLVRLGLLAADTPISLPSVSGYSGGGRSMIEAYEAHTAPPCELYALGLEHKHIPEIMQWGGLSRRPIFMPMVAQFPQGMVVQCPLHLDTLPGQPSAHALYQALQQYYQDSAHVKVTTVDSTGSLNAAALAGQDDIELCIASHPTQPQAVLLARLDNLGKGASGAAVQNLELMCGLACA